MASRLLARRVRNRVVSPPFMFEKSVRICRIHDGDRWRAEDHDSSACLGTTKATHCARHFSTFPVEIKASGISGDDAESLSSSEVVGCQSEPSIDQQQVENRPLHDTLSVTRDDRPVDESPLGLLLGVDRSLIQYITDKQDLERMVSMVESCSSLTSDEVASWVHPIMMATSNLESVDGASMTERLLAKCLELCETSQEEMTLEQYMDLPFPSAEMYNMAINSWARAGTRNSAQRATKLLELMSQEYQKGSRWVDAFGEEACPVRSPRPDLFNYTTVMNAWGKSGTRRGILQAQNMLEELEHLSGVSQLLSENNENRIEQSLSYLTPDQACYNAVITGWARSSNHEAPARIERLLQRMDALFKRSGDRRFEPDTRSFQMLITAYAKAAQQHRGKKTNQASVQAAMQAENVLRVMCNRYDDARRQLSRDSVTFDETFDSNLDIAKPDVMVYNAVISALANTASLEGAQRAESILLGMLGESTNSLGDFPLVEGVLPNVITFNSVINAWAKSGDVEAGARAERLLDVMESCEVAPVTITFNALMNSWSRSKATDSGERVESILKFMLEEGGDARPNVISFSTAIFAWGSSEDDDGALKAELLLEQIEALFAESNDEQIRPSEACYDGVIFAWLRRSGNRKHYDGLYAAERAEAILKRMTERVGLHPGLKQYNRVLNAWCKHESEDATEGPSKVGRARSLLQEMSSNAARDSRTGRNATLAPRPDVFAYNFVISACASCAHEAQRKREAFFTALETYNRLCESNECLPNNYTYRMMFAVCMNLLPRSSDTQLELMEKLFQECCNDGLLSNDILRTTRKYLPQWMMQRMLGPDVVLRGRKPVYIRDLPREWSHNFGPKGP